MLLHVVSPLRRAFVKLCPSRERDTISGQRSSKECYCCLHSRNSRFPGWLAPPCGRRYLRLALNTPTGLRRHHPKGVIVGCRLKKRHHPGGVIARYCGKWGSVAKNDAADGRKPSLWRRTRRQPRCDASGPRVSNGDKVRQRQRRHSRAPRTGRGREARRSTRHPSWT
jgi:hypothetical protein